jgi:hypothetical protein
VGQLLLGGRVVGGQRGGQLVLDRLDQIWLSSFSCTLVSSASFSRSLTLALSSSK